MVLRTCALRFHAWLCNGPVPCTGRRPKYADDSGISKITAIFTGIKTSNGNINDVESGIARDSAAYFVKSLTESSAYFGR